MKVNRVLPLLLCAVILAVTVVLSAMSKPQKAVMTAAETISAEKTAAEQPTADEPAPQQDEPEMRGVWVTYMDLSTENESSRSEAAFREKFAHIAKVCADSGFNTLIVQVRPFCDALYPSDYFPASHILTGQQGEAPGYDALKIICETCRAFGLKLHAWVNPYRVQIRQTPQSLADSNPFVVHPEMCIETESGVILNPADENARELIENGVRELLENYDIDGIQFDDYFYPDDVGDADAALYEGQTNGRMSLQKWRMCSINILLAEVEMLVHKLKPGAVFGISPQGNRRNNEKLCADVESWCSVRGYADYICPQIYFSLDNPALGFEDALADWTAMDMARDVKLYVGLAGYKAGTDADEETWLGRDDILRDEYLILKKNHIDGFMLYSYPSLESEEASAEIKNLLSAMQ